MATFVQAAKNDFTSARASFSVSFGAGVTAGNFIVVAGMCDGATTGVTISNGSGNSVTIVDALFNNATAGNKSFVQAFFAPTAGVTQVTATYSGTQPTYGDLYIWEFSGLSNPNFDKVVHATGVASGQQPDSGSSGTLSTSDQAAIGYGCTSTSITSAGAGWSTVAGDGITSNTVSLGEHRTVAATTAINATGGHAGGGQWTMHLATFMATGGSSTNITPSQGNGALSTVAPTVALTANVAPQPAARDLSLSTTAPTVALAANIAISPSAANLALSPVAPSLVQDIRISPDTAAGASVGGGASLWWWFLGSSGEVSQSGLVLSTTAPTITIAAAATSISPATVDLALSTTAPIAATTDHQSISPARVDLTLSTVAPTLSVGFLFTPATFDLSFSLTAPAAARTDHVAITPSAVDAALTTVAPSVLFALLPVPAGADLALSTTAPTVAQTTIVVAVPAAANLSLSTSEPTFSLGDSISLAPAAADLSISSQAPSVGSDVVISPAAADLLLSLVAPTLVQATSVALVPDSVQMFLSGSVPSLSGLIDYSGLIQPTGRSSATAAEIRLVAIAAAENRNANVSAEDRGT